MTNLAGHDMETVCDALHGLDDDTPTCVIAYTIKGYNLPFASHKDNHAGLMSQQQMEQFRKENGIAEGSEWEKFSGLEGPEEEL